MTYSAALSPDFRAMAQDLVADKVRSFSSKTSDGSELVPAEAQSRMEREGNSFLQRPMLNGSTVDQEGLTNNYGVEPIMYYAQFPSPEQQRRYAFQGAIATLFVTALFLTSFAVS